MSRCGRSSRLKTQTVSKLVGERELAHRDLVIVLEAACGNGIGRIFNFITNNLTLEIGL